MRSGRWRRGATGCNCNPVRCAAAGRGRVARVLQPVLVPGAPAAEARFPYFAPQDSRCAHPTMIMVHLDCLRAAHRDEGPCGGRKSASVKRGARAPTWRAVARHPAKRRRPAARPSWPPSRALRLAALLFSLPWALVLASALAPGLARPALALFSAPRAQSASQRCQARQRLARGSFLSPRRTRGAAGSSGRRRAAGATAGACRVPPPAAASPRTPAPTSHPRPPRPRARPLRDGQKLRDSGGCRRAAVAGRRRDAARI